MKKILPACPDLLFSECAGYEVLKIQIAVGPGAQAKTSKDSTKGAWPSEENRNSIEGRTEMHLGRHSPWLGIHGDLVRLGVVIQRVAACP